MIKEIIEKIKTDKKDNESMSNDVIKKEKPEYKEATVKIKEE